MATLTLQTDNISILDHLKGIISLMKDVRILSINNSSSIDDIPNATTIAAMKEAETGKDAGIVKTDSLQSFINSME